MAATKKISADVLGVLASMEVEQHGVVGDYRVARITEGQLPRDLYVSVDKVLKAMGGKWNRSAKGHVFDGDPSDAIEQAALTGEYTDKKQALQFFETPEGLADELVAAAEIRNEHRVLEPSAGRGRIVRAILATAPRCELFAVELDPVNAVHLRSQNFPASVRVIFNDFMGESLNCSFGINAEGVRVPQFLFDKCIMNPPFAKRQDVDHVTRAFSMLRPGGRLVSVVSGSALHRIDKKGEAFKALVKRCGRSWDLPEGTFKDSGTMVRASVVVLDKE